MDSDDWEDEDDFQDTKDSAVQYDAPVTSVEPVVWSIGIEEFEDFRQRFVFLARGESHLTPEFVKETFDAVLPGPDLFELWYVFAANLSFFCVSYLVCYHLVLTV
jgi:hypothetical protein